jgi:hypothetical protein
VCTLGSTWAAEEIRRRPHVQTAVNRADGWYQKRIEKAIQTRNERGREGGGREEGGKGRRREEVNKVAVVRA